MPCLLTIAGFFFPRVVLVALILMTNWFSQGFQTWYWPLLGFLFMPYTTLGYLIAMIYNAGQLSGGYIVLMIVTVFLDLGMHSDSGVKVKKRGKLA